jgi:glycolate oxidase iron-sulfur subunit
MTALYEKTLSCVHCGLCLTACPAYATLGRESVTPRGQVHNIRALLEGRLTLTKTLGEEIYDCLACRACETVCPSGVRVGAIVEEARSLVTESGTESAWIRFVKRFFLTGVLAHPNRLHWAIELLWLYEATGLRFLARVILGLLPGSLAEREALLPALPSKKERKRLPEILPAKGEKRGRIGLFTGCIASHMFADVNRATARVLQRSGYEVVVPRDQRCCGALHLHNGLPDVARELARSNISAFRGVGAEAVIVNAAGCGAALTEYGELLGGESDAAHFAEQVKDISVWLVEKGFEPPTRRLDARVAYDAPCHLFHAQRVVDEPQELLQSIPGLELVPFRDPERCCGSAGIYNITHYRESMKMLEEKMSHIRSIDPDIIATGNPGCLIQLRRGAEQTGLEAEVTHPVVLLDRAYSGR